MNLFNVELRRFCSRRATILFASVGMIFLAAMLAFLAASTHQPTPEELTQAESDAEQERQYQEQEREKCELAQSDPAEFAEHYFNEDTDYYQGEDCEATYSTSHINASDYLTGVISFAAEAQQQLYFLGFVFTICGLLMAGTFIGAEWTSGGMTNLLLWQPRRLRVYFAKLATVLVGVLTVTIVYSFIHMGSLWLIAGARGQIGTLDEQWWSDHLGIAGRLLPLVILAAACGTALAMIGRRTVTAIGAVVAYGVLIEYGVRFLTYTVDVSVEPFLLSTYLIAWLSEGYNIYNYGTPAYDAVEQPIFISMWAGGGVLAGFTALLVAASAVMFTKRDTT